MYTVKGKRLGSYKTEITALRRCEAMLVARVQDVGV